MKMKKAQAQIIGVTLILLVLVASSVTLFNWTQNFSEELQTKNSQNPRNTGNGIEIIGLEEKNGVLNAIIRSPITGYKEVNKITLNKENCTLLGTNVITGKSISVIPIECPTINDINNLVVYTKYNIIERSASVTLTNTYLSCTGPDSSTIPHSASKTFYATEIVPFGSSCVSEQRLCTDGILAGSYNAVNCIISEVYGNDDFTRLLIHSDGTHDSQEFKNSANSYQVFNQSYGYFDGAGDYLTIADSTDFNFGTDNFTIDFWIKPTNLSTRRSLFEKAIDSNNLFAARLETDGGIAFRIEDGGSGQGTTSTTTINLNSWNHIAFMKKNDKVYMYLNGGEDSWSIDVTGLNITNFNSEFKIGYGPDSALTSTYYQGYIDEFRISKGIQRWTENFTVPTEPHIKDSNDVLLLHFDNGEGSTSFVDSSDSSHTVSRVGNTIQKDLIQTNGDVKHHKFYEKKFGASSAYFDGTGDDLIVSKPINMELIGNEFTIDLWAKIPSTTTGIRNFLEFKDSTYSVNLQGLVFTGSGYGVMGANSIGFFDWTNGNSVHADFSNYFDKWTHITITGDKDRLIKLYFDGELQDSATLTKYINGPKGLIIGSSASSNYFYNGYIDELRISNGIQRWTSTFTPPTSEHTTDNYTSLLLHFDNGQDSPNFIDSGSSGHQITKFGDILINSGSGISNIVGTFDGTGDYLSIPDSNDFDLGNENFTIDFWIKPEELTSTMTWLFGDGNDGWIVAYYNNLLTLRFNYNTIGRDINFNHNLKLNEWQHVAFVRNGNNLYCYVDGIQVDTEKPLTETIEDISRNFILGSQDLQGFGGWKNLVGKIDEFRVSKGIARWTTNFTVPSSEYSSDPYTKMILHFNNEGNTFTDSSDSTHSITRNGDATQIHLDEKIGGYSTLDGTGDFLTIPASNDFNFKSEDFTIETWINIPARLDSGIISLDNWTNNEYSWTFRTNLNGSISLLADRNSGTWNITLISSALLNTDTWHHIAVSRENNTFYLFIDGNLDKTLISTEEIYPMTNDLFIGKRGTSGHYLNGKLDELRISKGIARYTSSFTPQTTPFETDEYTKMLLHFEDFEDSSERGHQIIPQGDIKQSGTHLENNFAGYFDGDGDYLEIADSDDWNFSTNDFTVDFWTKFPSLGNRPFVEIGKYNENGLVIRMDESGTNTLNIYFGGNGGNLITPITWNINKWYHIAVIRENNILKTYIDGKNLNSFDVTGRSADGDGLGLRIGKILSGAVIGGDFNGSIEELRISKGIARWKEDFIPPTSPYEPDEYTKLLIHFDPETNYSHFTDSSSNNHQITVVNDTSITQKYPFNGTAMYFDGTGDYLTLPDSNDWNLSDENFTIDFWFKNINNNANAAGILSNFKFDGSSGWNVYWYDQFDNIVFTSSDGIALTTKNKIKNNIWYHIAIVRENNNINLYLNGKLTDNTTYSGSISYSSLGMHLGKYYVDNTGYNLDGYIDELRISKGIARWNQTFIPPSQPYK